MQRKYQEDLEEFIKLTKTKRGLLNDKDFSEEYWHLNFYQLHTEEELKKFIAGLKLEEKELDDYTFNYYVNAIIKYMSGNLDSHTELCFPSSTRLPYKCKYFPNGGLYLQNTINEKFKKAKILKINNVDINDLIEIYKKRTNYACLNRLYSLIELNFNVLEILYSLPNFLRLDNLIIIETDKGLLKIDLQGQCTVGNDKVEDYYIKDKAMIFNYSSCHAYYIPVINELLKVLDSQLTSGNINKFILDLRNNGGGASNIIKPLIEYLKDKDLELITIVNKGVFSSGRFAAIAMQMIGSKIIGEQIGTPINCFGNVSKPLPLKNTKEQPIFAKTYWHLNYDKKKMQGIMTREELMRKDKNFFEPQFLELDEEFEENITDFMSDYDAFLEKALVSRYKSHKN